jgi:3-oxoacyl-[acyl-carrier protein] reductase
VIGAETFIGSSVCWALAGAGVRVAAHVNERSPLRKFNPAVQQGTSGGLSFFSSEKFGPPDERLFSSTENEIGPIDIYIHDLGIGCFPGPSSEEMELDTGAFTELMEGNLKWAMEIGRFLIRKISKNQVGKRIIYIAPCGWDRGQDSVGFDTAVAGTIALTENLAAALAPANTNVNCVIPGYIKIYPPSGMKASMPEVIQEKVPECRMGEVSDVTNAVLFLAGDESRYISSQVLRIAG